MGPIIWPQIRLIGLIINIAARTKVAGVDLNFGAILDPYAMQDGRLINQFQFSKNGQLARLTSANMSFGLSFKSKEGKEKDKAEEKLTPEEKSLLDQKKTARGKRAIFRNMPISVFRGMYLSTTA